MSLVPRLKSLYHACRNLFVLRLRGVVYGHAVVCHPTVCFQMPNNRLKLGNRVGIGRRCTIQVDMVVGNEVMIAANVGFVARDAHRVDFVGRAMIDSPRGDQFEILIADDVWIGFGAIVLSGVTIGEGAIIGAGSIVVDDVPPYSVVVSPKARIVGRRFTPEKEVAHKNARGAAR